MPSQTLVCKLNPVSHGYSPKMSAIVGAIIGHDYGECDSRGGRLTHITITLDGHVIANTTSHELGVFISDARDFFRNLDHLVADAHLSPEEGREFDRLYDQHVTDSRKPATREQRKSLLLGAFAELERVLRQETGFDATNPAHAGASRSSVAGPTDEEFTAVCEAARADISKYTSLTLTEYDMVFLHAIGAADWDWAGSLTFQRVIGEHGTIEEKRRLAAMNVGFRFID